MIDPLDGLPGIEPAAPRWGQEPVRPTPELLRRIDPVPSARQQLVVVLGAGGAFAPDVLNALLLHGTGCVIGVDVQLTYPVDASTVGEGAGYRTVDLRDGRALIDFFRDVRRYAAERELVFDTVYDLSTVQTSPAEGDDRAGLREGKAALLEALRETDGDARLFFMSTAEVYGAPEGAPYAEDHIKQPFNTYGRAKWKEEQQVMAAHGDDTWAGALSCVALRCWTICMVNVDARGEIRSTRNYNDPMIAVAERLGRAGVRVPVVDPDLRAQFHFSEEVAETAVLLGSSPPSAPTWGHAFNCPGVATTHGRLRDLCHEVFGDNDAPRPWWAAPINLLLRRDRLPRGALELTTRALEAAGGLLGARDIAARLPFFYRSTDIDSTAIRRALADRLTEPGGSSAEEALRRLATGILRGGPDALNFRRYRMY